MTVSASDDFPCSLVLTIPFPTPRLASIALQAIQVDKELSPLVQRHLAAEGSSLRVEYNATTDRMLRVAVNGFMDSLALVLDVMEHLDNDVLKAKYGSEAVESLAKGQGEDEVKT